MCCFLVLIIYLFEIGPGVLILDIGVGLVGIVVVE